MGMNMKPEYVYTAFMCPLDGKPRFELLKSRVKCKRKRLNQDGLEYMAIRSGGCIEVWYPEEEAMKPCHIGVKEWLYPMGYPYRCEQEVLLHRCALEAFALSEQDARELFPMLKDACYSAIEDTWQDDEAKIRELTMTLNATVWGGGIVEIEELEDFSMIP
jgi:hypothetical protein